jgi:hypothetical protein
LFRQVLLFSSFFHLVYFLLQENSNKSDTEDVDKADRPKPILMVSTTEQDNDIVTADDDADNDDGGDKFDEVYNSYMYSHSCHYAFYW